MPSSKQERVRRAKQLLIQGRVFPQGCSGFVSEVLEIPWEDANSILGSTPSLVGSNNAYSGIEPGDVVGWRRAGAMGHVAIYIGEPGMKFIDVPGPGKAPRKLGNGYGSQSLELTSKY